jgi:hypothetical protein
MFGVALGAFEVAPDRGLLQVRVHAAEAELAGKDRRLAGGVDDDLRADLTNLGLAIGAGELQLRADCSLAFHQHVEHAHFLHDVGAIFGRRLEQHLVELWTRHMPRLAPLVRVVPAKQKRRRLAAGVVHELNADFLRVAALLELVENAQLLEHEVNVGHQRLADVATGEPLALDQQNAEARLRYEGRRRRARRAGAHDNAVV